MNRRKLNLAFLWRAINLFFQEKKNSTFVLRLRISNAREKKHIKIKLMTFSRSMKQNFITYLFSDRLSIQRQQIFAQYRFVRFRFAYGEFFSKIQHSIFRRRNFPFVNRSVVSFDSLSFHILLPNYQSHCVYRFDEFPPSSVALWFTQNSFLFKGSWKCFVCVNIFCVISIRELKRQNWIDVWMLICNASFQKTRVSSLEKYSEKHSKISD